VRVLRLGRGLGLRRLLHSIARRRRAIAGDAGIAHRGISGHAAILLCALPSPSVFSAVGGCTTKPAA